MLAPAAFGVIYGRSSPAASGPSNRYERAAVGAGVVGVWNLFSFPLEFLFVGRGSIPAPFVDCGEDPTPDDLTCESGPGCSG